MRKQKKESKKLFSFQAGLAAILSAVLLLSCLSSGAYAFFNDSASSGVSAIQAASYDLTIACVSTSVPSAAPEEPPAEELPAEEAPAEEPPADADPGSAEESPADPASDISLLSNEPTASLADAPSASPVEGSGYVYTVNTTGNHTFTLTAAGTASCGQCKVTISDGREFMTQPIRQGSTLTVTVAAEGGQTITFQPVWCADKEGVSYPPTQTLGEILTSQTVTEIEDPTTDAMGSANETEAPSTDTTGSTAGTEVPTEDTAGSTGETEAPTEDTTGSAGETEAPTEDTTGSTGEAEAPSADTIGSTTESEDPITGPTGETGETPDPAENAAPDAQAASLLSVGEKEESPWEDMPEYYQNDYPDSLYGSGTVASGGCGVTSLAMVATYMTGHTYTPDELARYFGSKAANNIDRLEYGSDKLGLVYEKSENFDETYQALAEGKIAIALMGKKSLFTNSQHFIVLAGLTEDGGILVKDPNRDNYSDPQISDGFENGFPTESILLGYSGAWIYDKSAMPEDVPVFYEPPYQRGEPRYPEIDLSREDMELIAKLVWAEAQGECIEGQQAVAEVVLNRVRSDRFPGTVQDVIYAEGQFRSVDKLEDAKPWQAQWEAVEKAVYGPYVLPEGVVHFATEKPNDNVYKQIGNHIFCYDWDAPTP